MFGIWRLGLGVANGTCQLEGVKRCILAFSHNNGHLHDIRTPNSLDLDLELFRGPRLLYIYMYMYVCMYMYTLEYYSSLGVPNFLHHE